MSVLYSPAAAAVWLDRPVEWTCLECSEPLTWPCVYWHGHVLLLFHPDCAARLGPHLIADSREASLAGSNEPHWRRRLVSAVRHRLIAEEIAA